MAERLNEYHDWTERGRYDWATWLDGAPWRLTRGVDWPEDKEPERVKVAAHQAASRRGLTVRTHIPDRQTLIIQASSADLT